MDPVEAQIAQIKGSLLGLHVALRMLLSSHPNAEALLGELPDAAVLIAQGMRKSGADPMELAGFIESILQTQQGLAAAVAKEDAAQLADELLGRLRKQ